MENPVIIAGAVLLILGITVYGVSDMKVGEYEDASGIFDRALDDSAQQSYSNWQTAKTGGFILTGIGAVLLVTSTILTLKESS